MTCRVIAGIEKQYGAMQGTACNPISILADAIAEAIPTIRGKPLEKLFNIYSILVGVEDITEQDILAMHARIAEWDRELKLCVDNEESYLMYKWRDKINEVRQRQSNN